MISFKIVVVGSGGVGKTSYIRRFAGLQNEEKEHDGPHLKTSTLSVDVRRLVLKTNREDHSIVVNLWDTIGQEKFGALKDEHYFSADAAIIMFDVTSRSSYKNVPIWFRDIIRVCDNIPICLVGNKIDCQCLRGMAEAFPKGDTYSLLPRGVRDLLFALLLVRHRLVLFKAVPIDLFFKISRYIIREHEIERTVKAKNITFHRKKNIRYYDVSSLSNYNIREPLLYLLRELTGEVRLQVEFPVGDPVFRLSERQVNQSKLDLQRSFPSGTLPVDDDDF